jgi:hypothetical protein
MSQADGGRQARRGNPITAGLKPGRQVLKADLVCGLFCFPR